MQIGPPPRETIEALTEAIEQGIPDCDVRVTGSGGHFEIQVASGAFDGLKTLARQRMVYAAIGHLMKGEGAPVHAIDRLQTLVP